MHKDWYVAVVAAGEAFNPAIHARRDMPVDTVSLVEREVDRRARLALTVIRNPADPYKPVANSWVIVSREKADGTIVPYARGHLLQVPVVDPDEDTMTLEYNCSPLDFDAAERPVLDAWRAGAGYDRVLVSPAAQGDRTEILDGYFLETHCHRVTHAVTAVDLFGVGLPLVVVDTCIVPGPSVEQTHQPWTDVLVELTSEWYDRRRGNATLTGMILEVLDDEYLATCTANFANSWPAAGEDMQGNPGWTVKVSELVETTPPDAIAYPPVLGPVNGASSNYNYIDDPNLDSPIPIGFGLDVTYYVPKLELSYFLEVKRVEIAAFVVASGHQGSQSGARTTVLRLTTEDLQVADEEPQWQPGAVYAAGDRRTARMTTYESVFDHVANANFDTDLALGRWSVAEGTEQPLGSFGATTYYNTPRGVQTITAAIYKARAIIAAGQRCVEIVLKTPLLDRYLDLTTAHQVRVVVPGDMLPGGEVTAKVTAIEMGSSQEDELLTITLTAAIGSGLERLFGTSQNGEPWDRIPWSITANDEPVVWFSLRKPEFEFLAQDQLDYVQANDFNPSLGRTDREETDPAKLLRDVPTKIDWKLEPLTGWGVFRHTVPVVVSASYAGPRQYDIEV